MPLLKTRTILFIGNLSASTTVSLVAILDLLIPHSKFGNSTQRTFRYPIQAGLFILGCIVVGALTSKAIKKQKGNVYAQLIIIASVALYLGALVAIYFNDYFFTNF